MNAQSLATYKGASTFEGYAILDYLEELPETDDEFWHVAQNAIAALQRPGYVDYLFRTYPECRHHFDDWINNVRD